MPHYIDNLNAMLSVWNTTDEAEKTKLVENALEHNVHFVDPNHNIMGRAAFLEMVKTVQNQIPNAEYTHVSDIGYQNNFCRYHWHIHLKGKLLMEGFDVTEVNDAGKIVKVIGFFGPLKITSK